MTLKEIFFLRYFDIALDEIFTSCLTLLFFLLINEKYQKQIVFWYEIHKKTSNCLLVNKYKEKLFFIKIYFSGFIEFKLLIKMSNIFS
jgi:hypothetical protein